MRVNGRAYLETDGGLLASFAVEGKAPRSVMVIEVGEVCFQCARAVIRAGVWDAERHVDPRGLPTPGRILAALSADRVGGEEHDRAWAGRAAETTW